MMVDYRIIPPHPWEAVRERYRELAAQVRPAIRAPFLSSRAACP